MKVQCQAILVMPDNLGSRRLIFPRLEPPTQAPIQKKTLDIVINNSTPVTTISPVRLLFSRNRSGSKDQNLTYPEMSTKTKKPAGKATRSAIADVVAREYTIHLHKRVRWILLEGEFQEEY